MIHYSVNRLNRRHQYWFDTAMQYWVVQAVDRNQQPTLLPVVFYERETMLQHYPQFDFRPSGIWNAVRDMDIRTVVADPEWQSLRKSFLGTWKHVDMERENILCLLEYLDDYQDPYKVRRVLNYLTGSGFRMGKIGLSDHTKSLREMVQTVWRANQSFTSKTN
jgi:hypothetical protein